MKALPVDSLKRRYSRIKHTLNEATRRLWAGSEAAELGYGGIGAVARATGMSLRTVAKGVEEVRHQGQAAPPAGPARQRKEGGGRKKLTVVDPRLDELLESLIEPYTSGDPMRPLRWTCKSTTRLAGELARLHHPVSPDTVGRMLKANGYRLQASDEEFASLSIERADFHGEWNYYIKPRLK